MLNKNVIDVLTQLNGITNSVILKYPTTVAVSESQDIMVSVDFSELDKDSFPEIGLNNSLDRFLTIVKLFPEDREITFTENNLNIVSGSDASVYITDNIVLMDAYNKNPEQMIKTEEAPSVATFELTSDDMKKIKSATGAFKELSEVIFTSQDGDIKISLGATNKFNAKSNTYSVTKAASTSKEFEIKIPVDNFRKLPDTNYTISVKYNAAKNSYRIFMNAESLSNFKVLLSVKL